MLCAQLSTERIDAAARSVLCETVHEVYRKVRRRFGDDVAQEMMLELLQSKCLHFDVHRTAALLWRIARRSISRTLRRRDRESVVLERLARAPEGIQPDPAEDLEREEVRRRVRGALRKLREDERALIVHVDLLGRPLHEFDPRIAHSNRVRSRFHVRLFRARKRLSVILLAR